MHCSSIGKMQPVRMLFSLHAGDLTFYSPLGMFYPPFKQLSAQARNMFTDLEINAEEHGFLGQSNYRGTDTLTQPKSLNIIYFRSLEHMHKWAQGKGHREGWDWWNTNSQNLDEITIAHEVYSIPAGNWENIYHNSIPFDFGRCISH